MRENLHQELSQVVGLAKGLYKAAQDRSTQSDALFVRIETLLTKLNGLESKVAIAVKAEVGSQFSQAAKEATNTIIQRQQQVSTAAEKAILAYDAAVRYSAQRIFLTWFGAGLVGIAMMAAFALYTVNRWADWAGLPSTTVPVFTCRDNVGTPLQCVRISAPDDRPNCTPPKDGVASCVLATK